MILGIETSTPHASLALVAPDANEPVWESSFETERAHNAVIFDPVQEVIGRFKREITGIAVGVGPGSYGGVRVGIAVANGLSLVLNVPIVGVSSLEAWESEEENYTVLGDARRKSFFVARIVGHTLQGEPDLMSEEEAVSLIGESETREGGRFFTADRKVAEMIPAVSLSHPAARLVASRASRLSDEVWAAEATLEPHYLRAPYITIPKAK